MWPRVFHLGCRAPPRLSLPALAPRDIYMIRRAFTVTIVAIAAAAPLRAQDSVACKGAHAGPMNFLASGLSPWRPGRDGVSRMNLVGRADPSPTEFVAYRERYPATYLGDSTKVTVHRNIGTVHILVMSGTLMVGFGPEVDYSKAAAYGPGSFTAIAAGDQYYVWSRGAVEIQVEAVGQPRIGPVPRVHPSGQPMSPTLPAAISKTSPPESPPAPANGLGEWKSLSIGGGRMPLVESHPTSPTELVAFRIYYLPPFMQDSTKAIYHYHFGTEHITILCGTLVYGEGNKVDLSKAKDYGPGSFLENPAGNPHFEWFRGPVESQVEFIGPGSAVSLDPLTGKPTSEK